MDYNQIIYKVDRLLANPRVFMAIANHFDGPDWETLADAFYELLESEFEDTDTEPKFECPEVAFRESPDDPEVYQVILATGNAIELKPNEEEGFSIVQSADELAVSSVIYSRLIKAIESARPDLAGNVSLDQVPVAGNDYLRGTGDKFSGEFSLLTDSDKKFDFEVEIISIDNDDLRAVVTEK